MLMQNFGVTNKEHYGMLWYFLEWSIWFLVQHSVAMLSNVVTMRNHVETMLQPYAALWWLGRTTQSTTLPSFLHSKLGCLLFFYRYTVVAQSVEQHCKHRRSSGGRKALFCPFLSCQNIRGQTLEDKVSQLNLSVIVVTQNHFTKPLNSFIKESTSTIWQNKTSLFFWWQTIFNTFI